MTGIQWTYSIPGPLVTSYDMPGIQWTYSIPGPLATSYNMPGIQWTYSIPGPLVTSLYTTCLEYSGPIQSPGPWSPHIYDMPGIQWTYSIPGSLVASYDTPEDSGPILSPGRWSPHYIRHAWNTVDLFNPRALGHLIIYDMPGIQWTYSIPGPLVTSLYTTCLEYSGPILSPGPWSPHYIRHAWNTVDLFYPRALGHLNIYDMPGIQWTYSIPGPLVISLYTTCLEYSGPIQSPGPWSPHYIRHAWNTVDLFNPRALGHLIIYDMPGIQWTYSIPGPLATSIYTTCLEYSGPIQSPGPWSPNYIRHAWNAVDVFNPRVLSHLIRHAWNTVDLFYPRALGHLIIYDMPGIQWTYSILGPLVTSLYTTCLEYCGPIQSPGP